MVALGRVNSHVKDYDDVWMQTSTFDLNPDRMRQPIAVTSPPPPNGDPEPGARWTGRCVCSQPGEATAMARVQNLSGQAPDLTQVAVDVRRRLASALLPR